MWDEKCGCEVEIISLTKHERLLWALNDFMESHFLGIPVLWWVFVVAVVSFAAMAWVIMSGRHNGVD